MPAENFFANSEPINDPDDLLANLESRPPTETNHYAVLNISKSVKLPSALLLRPLPTLWQKTTVEIIQYPSDLPPYRS